MFIKLLLRLMFGYVRIEIEGYYIEKFINICKNKNILIWNLKRENGVKLYLNIGINDFKRISEIVKKTNCKVKILKKRGIPFVLHRYKKRKLFLLFLIILICAIYISSKYVWNIEVKVEDYLKIENIEEDLNRAGLKKGILKSKIDTTNIINNLRLNRDDIAWIGIDIEGTNVKVDIVKADDKPKILDNSDFCDIVATKQGTITKITAQNGTAMVNIGDEVNKGDILIAGYMDGKYTSRRYLHSLGEVIAKITYEKTEEIYLNEDKYIPTGKVENKYEIGFNNSTVRLYKKQSKFELYKSEINDNKLKIAKNFYLPIFIRKITNTEQRKNRLTRTKEEALKFGTEKLSKELEDKIENNKIVSKDVKKQEGQNSVTVTVIYEVEESIGEFRKIEM